jgi:phosphoribosylaminoimidazole-succinocarboxamide synthase
MNTKERTRNKIFESSTKVLYETEDEFILAQFFKDSFKIGDNVIQISGKGVLNNTISATLMDKLDMVAIENHYIEKINMREQLIQAVDIINARVVVNNISYGRYVNELAIEEGYVFDMPMLDFRVKNNNIITSISEEQLKFFGWMNTSEIKLLKKQAYRVNDFLTGFFAGVGLRLVQIQLEFGRIFNGEEIVMMLAGEISPETCVLFDLNSNEKFSLDMLANSADDINNNFLYVYQEIAKRLA